MKQPYYPDALGPLLRCGIILVVAGFASASYATAEQPSSSSSAPGPVSFARDVRPIFNKHCVGCHGGVKRAGEISFIVPERVIARNSAETGKPVQPGHPERSELIRRITATDPQKRMPPPEHGPALEPKQVEILKRWIAEGATWGPHWAFLKPIAPPTPQLKNPGWCSQPLDAFVLNRIEAAGMKPSPPASRRAWLRRVSFDLTGLPPTPDEISSFEQDASVGAFETVVDRLLASPRYGERWASVWLDLARYADSMGFEKDPHRKIWPWRDWVIRALNRNLPFDDFTVRQLAGDLLPDATLEDRLATAFHRNTQNNTEGGTDDEEFRVAAVLDRINTTFEVWQGITFKCAQCHAHPYEPIEHAEYFRAMAFFNTSQDWDIRDEYPLLQVPQSYDETSWKAATDLDRQISKLRRAEFAEATARLAPESQWARLMPQKAESTRGTKLAVEPGGEVRTVGTVAHYSTFTVEAPVPGGISNLTAIRLEVLPVEPAKARLTPEPGFIVSHVQVGIVDPSAPPPPEPPVGTNAPPKPPPLPGQIRLAYAFGDEAEPFRPTTTLLQPNQGGWGALPRLDRLRRLVLVPESPVSIPPGAKLTVVLAHDDGAGDSMSLVMHRFRLDASGNSQWSDFVASEHFRQQRSEVAELEKQRSAIKSLAVPVMAEQETSQLRPTAVFVRGNWLDKGQEVTPGVPHIYPPLPDDSTGNRLALARWLVSTNNPLTGRVTVNRVWEQLFGLGLVKTLEDFGSSGLPPSNPELLDFLAVRFQTSLAWDLKKLLRELVLSSTYRQDSTATAEGLTSDPHNLLLARGPRSRLSAEMIRDQALAVSGLLSTNMFGPPVMPPQPDGIWRAAYSGEKWVVSPGQDKYRRAVYTYVRRTAGYPSYQAFDLPSRDICTARRLRTNTPLQALVTLNDPVYVECAVALARRISTETGKAPPERIRRAWELVTGATPAPADVNDLVDLYERSLSRFQLVKEADTRLAPSPEEAALAVVANTILNLDSALTR